MDMRRHAGGNFVKVDDVRDGPMKERINTVKDGKFERPDMVFESGSVLTLNTTNTRILIKAYGPDSDDWRGKEVELGLGQVEFNDRMQDSVVIKPISPPISPTERQAAAAKVKEQNVRDMNDDIPF